MSSVKNRKQIAAEATQKVIIEAAARLFLENGYHATPIGQIASEAGVAVQTIYNAIGSKRDLLSRVLDDAAAGERAPTPVAKFMQEQAEREADPRRIIDQLIDFWRRALPATAPVFRVIREAAATDPAVAKLERRRANQRLKNYAQAAELIAKRGPLRDNLTIEQAAATIFAVGHPDIYRSLVLEGQWSFEQWANWARSTLHAGLLGTESPQQGP